MIVSSAAGRAIAVGSAALLLAAPAGAQVLAPKRALTLPTASACLRLPASAGGRADERAARAAASRARELVLVGERAAAREAFAEAAALAPGNAQAQYDLARLSEELGDAAGALGAYCRYLALAPAARDAADVRGRVARLAPAAPAPQEADARADFARGLAALDARRWTDAAAAFDAVLRRVPDAPEALFDRALARLGSERDADAAADLAAYVASPLAGVDRGEALRAADALRRPRWSPNAALLRGLVVPGLGQIYTGRPVLGVVVLGATAGAIAFGLTERQSARDEVFTDRFGNVYTSRVVTTERPNFTTGIAAAGALALAGAIEARMHAASQRRARPRVLIRTSALSPVRPEGSPRHSSVTSVGLEIALPR